MNYDTTNRRLFLAGSVKQSKEQLLKTNDNQIKVDKEFECFFSNTSYGQQFMRDGVAIRADPFRPNNKPPPVQKFRGVSAYKDTFASKQGEGDSLAERAGKQRERTRNYTREQRAGTLSTGAGLKFQGVSVSHLASASVHGSPTKRAAKFKPVDSLTTQIKPTVVPQLRTLNQYNAQFFISEQSAAKSVSGCAAKTIAY